MSRSTAVGSPTRRCARPSRRRDDTRVSLFGYHPLTSPRQRRSNGFVILVLLLCAARAAAQDPAATVSLIERVVSRDDPPPRQYRALRRLEAQSDKLGGSAWLEAWTEADPERGFRYEIVAEGGSGFVRGRVLRPWLNNEKKMWANGDPERASLTHENYTFVDRGLTPEGLAQLDVKSRRKDLLLVDGAIFVNPEDGDLVRIQGRLSKTPSFWTRRVEIVRHYRRINGVRVPAAIESIAQVLIAGRSTFKMTYEYETINGERVGNPEPSQKK
jgi:hypothetical protein